MRLNHVIESSGHENLNFINESPLNESKELQNCAYIDLYIKILLTRV